MFLPLYIFSFLFITNDIIIWYRQLIIWASHRKRFVFTFRRRLIITAFVIFGFHSDFHFSNFDFIAFSTGLKNRISSAGRNLTTAALIMINGFAYFFFYRRNAEVYVRLYTARARHDASRSQQWQTIEITNHDAMRSVCVLYSIKSR